MGRSSRGCRRARSVITDVGPVTVRVSRDRGGVFEPQIVEK
ncbi:transposase, partial [Streptomyces virginiae]